MWWQAAAAAAAAAAGSLLQKGDGPLQLLLALHPRSRISPSSAPLPPHTLKLTIMSHESLQEDIQPLHPANLRAVPSPDARITLMNLPKEQAQLNGLNAVVLSQAAAKSSSGAVKVLNPKP